jgi:predicted nucleic acid-binding protein
MGVPIASSYACDVNPSAAGGRKEVNTERSNIFLAAPMALTAFDEEDARIAGTIRAQLEAAGRPIGLTIC